jgi:hypothetical protein
VSPKRLTNFMIDPDLAEGLKIVKARDGVSEGEQIRRGIRMWLKSKGISVETDRKRAATRKRR